MPAESWAVMIWRIRLDSCRPGSIQPWSVMTRRSKLDSCLPKLVADQGLICDVSGQERPADWPEFDV
eukprot:1160105-Pelagomonas_calceolata.AAC.3